MKDTEGISSNSTRKLLWFGGKGSPYSITERRVPELIPVLVSQPAGDVSHKPDGRLPFTFRQAYSYPRNPATNFAAC